MITALTIIHGIISVLLVVLVLLQFGKGAEAGLMMDSGASSILPQKGNVMTKITAVMATLFLGLALFLAILRSHISKESIFDSKAPQASNIAVPTLPTSAPKAAPSAASEAPVTPSEATTAPSDSQNKGTETP
jgi:preprotein translocase subunit SecG